MTRRDLAEFIVKRGALSEVTTVRKAEEMVGEVLDSIATLLTTNKDEDLEIRGFATFKHVRRAGRKVHNFKTGETEDMPSRRAIKIVWSNVINKKLNS